MDRRSGRSSGKDKSTRSKFEEFRRLRETGATRLDTYEVEEQEDIYEEVDDEGYKKIVKDRLLQDDFIVDDQGEGYVDYGVDDWDDGDRAAYTDSEGETEKKPTTKAVKRKREEEEKKRKEQEGNISKYFTNVAASIPAKPKPRNTAEDAAFLADILGDFDDTPVKAPTALKKKRTEEPARKTRRLSPPVREKAPKPKKPSRFNSDDEDHDSFLPTANPAPKNKFIQLNDDFLNDNLDSDMAMSDGPPPPSSPTRKFARYASPKKESEDEFDDDIAMAEIHDSGIKTEAVNFSATRPAPKIEPKVEAKPAVPVAAVPDASEWTSVTANLQTAASSTSDSGPVGKLQASDVLLDDGTFDFFWMDAVEVRGSICLFGKVAVKSTNKFASCFIKVDGVLRNLYFLPREFRHRNGQDTEEPVDIPDVYQEITPILNNLGVTSFKSKPCNRKYAFELPDIPKESEYLKVLYPYGGNPLPMDLRGETFSHVFGTNTSLFEQFVLCRNIMGPSWLKIKNPKFGVVTNASWCKVEVQVDDPFDVTPLPDTDSIEPPPLSVMSLSLRTMLNPKDNKQEIVALSARVYDNLSINEPSPAESLPSQTFTIVRPVDRVFPPGFELAVKRFGGRIRVERTEQALLNFFLGKLQHLNPDVLMGHNFENIDYGILLHRMRDLKINNWHRIGRLRRSEWPKHGNRPGGSAFADRMLIAGRLMCDLANDLGKSLTLQCQSWSLTEMCDLLLGQNRIDIDVAAAFKNWANTKDGLIQFLEHAEADTFYITALALRIQILPLSKQLTNLAGNSWARTMTGTRAERNEYILLHEFHRNKYICPDKLSQHKGKAAAVKAEEEPNDDETTAVGKKKDKYKGGLVFEPEKGLYDKYILVMDFNSLYPSIIQEFNICFTTVERADCDDETIPEIPKIEEKDGKRVLGILPKLIATLVNRRKQVKSLMKDRNATKTQKSQWDIKQQALKLTANSMYGCLGYERSRFYARPLAALTTYKGREILMSTKELAQSNGLQVVYGDTDSVMINTNADNYKDALKIGNDFKKEVNDLYHLLEIDIDNVFKRLLLQAKKKYAAINLIDVNGKLEEKLEIKGLDMKRREYCALSKEASRHILDEIFNAEDREVLVERIHDYLRELAEKIREGKFPVRQFTIYTKLGKNPEEYPNGKAMPQVQVALRKKSRGEIVKVNDVIAYIVTGDGKIVGGNVAERAYSVEDVLKPDLNLTPDYEWYLVKQIFPQIERLCAQIEGTDSMRLAECLGLDTRKYQISTAPSGTTDHDLHPLESTIPDSERFSTATKLTLTCRYCHEPTPFLGLLDSPTLISPTGLLCSNPSCAKVFPDITVTAQLEAQIRRETTLYYDAYLLCSDSLCGNRTRQMSVYGKRCLGPKGLARGCRGVMGYEYGDKKLYNQLLYWQSLFDVEKAKRNAVGEGRKDEVMALAAWNGERFERYRRVVERYLDKCGRRWVQMESLFGFMMPGVQGS